MCPTLVGIDHGFSFPLRYFEAHGLLPDWPRFLDDFQRHWPTDDDNTYVDFVRDGIAGNGAARTGNARWRRLTEERAGGAKSVFHFDVQGSVAKSTHAGIPWLRFIRQRLGARVHFWPFDGWDIPAGRSAIAEVYPSLWSRGFANEGRTGDQPFTADVCLMHWFYWCRLRDFNPRPPDYKSGALPTELSRPSCARRTPEPVPRGGSGDTLRELRQHCISVQPSQICAPNPICG